MYDKLIADLKEDAEWAAANEWETPLMLSDHIRQAVEAIETLGMKLMGDEVDMVDFICDKIAEYFDSPCNYEFGSLDVAEYMVDKLPEWCDNTCESKCESKKYGECWKRFFELLKEESENGKTDN